MLSKLAYATRTRHITFNIRIVYPVAEVHHTLWVIAVLEPKKVTDFMTCFLDYPFMVKRLIVWQAIEPWVEPVCGNDGDIL
jgi:hypothetical protein